ncbi:chromosome partitioning protein ParB [Nostoc sp. 3335mG]|nr:chromosome partitioning protein ParB [Nostoc sp. 3335mG]
MKLEFLAIDKLHRSRTNMRHSKKPQDVTDILPSVREKGILIPIVVRPEPDEAGHDGFGVVAGDRRYTAALIVAAEVREAGGEPELVPCAIREEGEDVDALELSILENCRRRDPDEVTQWESFTRLVKEGRSIDEIATTFVMPELAVKRTLALGNLLPRVRSLYRAGEIDAITVRHLTLATKSQQKAWLALVDDENAYVPSGHNLKNWLFGGQSIPVKHALFDVGGAKIATADFLFDDSSYFSDNDAFWTAQNAAIEARRAAYIEAGWADVVVVPPSNHFSTWEFERIPKRKGGRVYIDVRASGEVCFHEGYVSRKEAQRAERIARGEAEEGVKVPRPEVTSAMRTYIDLHRHAAVRAELTTMPQVALRLLVAHAIAGSHLWRVEADPRRSQNGAVQESADGSAAEGAFDGYRRAVQDALGYPEDEVRLVGRHGHQVGIAALFERLMALPDPVVMNVVAVIMGETLASGSAAVEVAGQAIGTDMAKWWEADDAFFELIRDREVLTAIVGEVAGDLIAMANVNEKAKAMKAIIRAHLEGADGRAKVEHWVPRWMRFAPGAYTERGKRRSRQEALDAMDRAGADDADPEDEAELDCEDELTKVGGGDPERLAA